MSYFNTEDRSNKAVPARTADGMSALTLGRSAQQLFDAAFSRERQPRSQVYKDGVMAALVFHETGQKAVLCPHPEGSVEYDAFFAGVVEGHQIYRSDWAFAHV